MSTFSQVAIGLGALAGTVLVVNLVAGAVVGTSTPMAGVYVVTAMLGGFIYYRGVQARRATAQPG
jgi:hypothetical protein